MHEFDFRRLCYGINVYDALRLYRGDQRFGFLSFVVDARYLDFRCIFPNLMLLVLFTTVWLQVRLAAGHGGGGRPDSGAQFRRRDRKRHGDQHAGAGRVANLPEVPNQEEAGKNRGYLPPEINWLSGQSVRIYLLACEKIGICPA